MKLSLLLVLRNTLQTIRLHLANTTTVTPAACKPRGEHLQEPIEGRVWTNGNASAPRGCRRITGSAPTSRPTACRRLLISHVDPPIMVPNETKPPPWNTMRAATCCRQSAAGQAVRRRQRFFQARSPGSGVPYLPKL